MSGKSSKESSSLLLEREDTETRPNGPPQNPGALLSRTRKVLMGISVAGGYTALGMGFSLQPPFYPSEAESRGANPSQYGFVFGMAHLAAMLASPIFAVYAGRMGARRVYIAGVFTVALAGGILFGLLDFIENTAAFLGLSYLLRFCFGVGDSASLCAILGILITLFPAKAATLMAMTETFFGLGYTIGPAVGSFLYIAGGFQLPFYSVGCVGIVFGIMLCLSMPKIDKKEKKSEEYEEIEDSNAKALTIKAVLLSPSIWFPYLDNAFLQSGYGFVEAMLEPHAKGAAGMDQAQVGYAFVIMGVAYMVCTPLVGHFSDRIKRPPALTAISIGGNVAMAIAMLLIGPPPFMANVLPSRALIYTATAIEGVAYALNMVSTFARAYTAATRAGYTDDLNTYIMLTGMWTFSFYVGNFAGPTIAGIVVDKFSFRFVTETFFFLYCFAIVFDVLDIWYKIVQEKIVKTGQIKAEKDGEEE